MKPNRPAVITAFVIPLILVLSTCTLPPFDLEITLAYATASKMNLEAEIGPLYSYQGNFEGAEFFYLPSKTYGPDRGFIVVFNDYQGRILFVNGDGSGNSWVEDWDSGFSLVNTNKSTFNQAAFLFKDIRTTTIQDYLLILSRTTQLFQVYNYDDVTGFSRSSWDRPITNDLSSIDYFIPTTGTSMVGVTMIADPATDTDRLCMLTFDGIYHSDYVFDLVYPTQPSWQVPTEYQAPPLISVPSSPWNGFYGHYPSTKMSYLSIPTGSSYDTYGWTAVFSPLSEPISTPISGRILAVLSTGEILAKDGDRGIVYGADGRKKFEFPMGSLHFAHEYRTATQPGKLYFTMMYQSETGGGDEEFSIRVYSIPTADLDELK